VQAITLIKQVVARIIVPRTIPTSCIGKGIVKTAVAKTKLSKFAIKKIEEPQFSQKVFLGIIIKKRVNICVGMRRKCYFCEEKFFITVKYRNYND